MQQAIDLCRRTDLELHQRHHRVRRNRRRRYHRRAISGRQPDLLRLLSGQRTGRRRCLVRHPYNYSLAALGNYYFATAIHELGHAVGLKHSQETGGVANVAVPTAHDDFEFTVMSYRSYEGGPLTGYTNEAYGYPQTYMANDILALQTLYGANYTTHSENTVYSWSPTTGQEFINGVAQPAPGGGAGGSANRIFETVWDGNGIDTYDLSNYTTA